jgi:nucleoside-diphosphate-sugar epimerase
MRVFIAGASGAIGIHLVPQLLDRGHEVIGTCHSPANAQRLQALGATPVVLNLLDPPAVQAAVREARPDAILHQATALGHARFGRSLDRTFAATNRLRTEGTDALLAAAETAGVRRVVAQSFAPYRYARIGGPVKTEDDPLDPTPPAHTEATYAAMSHVDQAVTAAGGVALRYGGFYGAPTDGLVKPVRKRFLPVIGDGDGVMSFIHLHDAAAATVLALEHEASGIYNIVDDDPAPTTEWLPALAAALGAKPPRHLAAGLARIVAGPAALITATRARGASNAKAKAELAGSCATPAGAKAFPPLTPLPPRPRTARPRVRERHQPQPCVQPTQRHAHRHS